MPGDWRGWMLGLSRDCFEGQIKTPWGDFGEPIDIEEERAKKRLGKGTRRRLG